MVQISYYENYHKTIEKEYLTRRDRNNHFFVKEYIGGLSGGFEDISSIEIETISGCNGMCSFCPVSRKYDTRPQVKMEETLFRRIIDTLSRKQYAGYLSCFSNNEPLLDDRIISFLDYARQKLPAATHSLYTNGMLLTESLYQQLTQRLDRLVIDNYSRDVKLHPHIERILDRVPSGRCEVNVFVRSPDEVLDSRAGNAPNRTDLERFGSTCLFPFTQLVFKPTGDMTLCCQDSYGKTSLGNLHNSSMDEVLHGAARRQILDVFRVGGRGQLPQCSHCDIFGTVNYHMHPDFPEKMKAACVSVFRKALERSGRRALALPAGGENVARLRLYLEGCGFPVACEPYREDSGFFYLFPTYDDDLLHWLDPDCQALGKTYLVADILYYLLLSGKGR